MATMKAIQIDACGPSEEVLKLVDVPRPTKGADQVGGAGPAGRGCGGAAAAWPAPLQPRPDTQ